jgi:hypothetical protein
MGNDGSEELHELEDAHGKLDVSHGIYDALRERDAAPKEASGTFEASRLMVQVQNLLGPI